MLNGIEVPPPVFPPGGEDILRDDKGLSALLDKIYHERSFDFRGYLRSSLARRIARRLIARGTRTYEGYARVLDEDPEEYDRLFNEITVNVTSFFRDQAAFRALERVASLKIREKSGAHLRIWSAGCATGQEPYTIAMLLMNLMDREHGLPVSILATDIDSNALERAKKGVFDRASTGEIPPTWPERYFICEGDYFRVRPSLRDLITFEAHNLATDPPYRELDIVVCRNVLIYFDLPLQGLVINNLLDALSEGGYLFLGRYEMLMREARGRFRCVDFDARLYQKRWL